MSDYFGYEVLYVMNITDIDDKIIKRARQNHLYEKYLEENHSLDEVLEDAKSVLLTFQETVKSTTDNDKKCMLEQMLQRVKLAVEALEKTVTAKNEEETRHFQQV